MMMFDLLLTPQTKHQQPFIIRSACLSALKTTEAVREFKLFLYLAVLYLSHPLLTIAKNR
jgi:hypothetical protein